MGRGRLLNLAVAEFPAKERVAKLSTGIAALGLTLVPYGIAEPVSSCGFAAVFVASCVFRQYEIDSRYRKPLHDFSEEAGCILIGVILVLLGVCTVAELFDVLSWGHVLFAFILIFVVRALAGWRDCFRHICTGVKSASWLFSASAASGLCTA